MLRPHRRLHISHTAIHAGDAQSGDIRRSPSSPPFEEDLQANMGWIGRGFTQFGSISDVSEWWPASSNRPWRCLHGC
jgi:hypothetical protein